MRIGESSSGESRELRLLFDASPLPTWVYDAETLRFVAVNRAATEHYGYSEEEFLANTILFIRPGEDVQHVLDCSHDSPGIDRLGVFRHRREDGSLIDVETISYGFDLDGHPGRRRPRRGTRAAAAHLRPDAGAGKDEATRIRAFESFFTTKGPAHGALATVYGIVRWRDLAAQRTRYRHARAHSPPARRLLQRSGYQVIEASDGGEGKRLFAERRGDIDVVVTDVVMPILGGVDMVTTMHAAHPGLPAVFVSGYTAEEQGLPLDERTAFLSKPYTIESLCGAIVAVVPS